MVFFNYSSTIDNNVQFEKSSITIGSYKDKRNPILMLILLIISLILIIISFILHVKKNSFLPIFISFSLIFFIELIFVFVFHNSIHHSPYVNESYQDLKNFYYKEGKKLSDKVIEIQNKANEQKQLIDTFILEKQAILDNIKSYVQSFQVIQNVQEITQRGNNAYQKLVNLQTAERQNESLSKINLNIGQISEIQNYILANSNLNEEKLRNYILTNYPKIGIADVQNLLNYLVNRFNSLTEEITTLNTLYQENRSLPSRIYDLDILGSTLYFKNNFVSYSYGTAEQTICPCFSFVYSNPPNLIDQLIYSKNHFKLYDNRLLKSLYSLKFLDYFIYNYKLSIEDNNSITVPITIAKNAMYNKDTTVKSGTITSNTLISGPSNISDSTGNISPKVKIKKLLQNEKLVGIVVIADLIYPLKENGGKYGYFIIPEGIKIMFLSLGGQIYSLIFNEENNLVYLQTSNGLSFTFPPSLQQSSDSSYHQLLLTEGNFFTTLTTINSVNGYLFSNILKSPSNNAFSINGGNNRVNFAGNFLIEGVEPIPFRNNNSSKRGYIFPLFFDQTEQNRNINYLNQYGSSTNQTKYSPVGFLFSIISLNTSGSNGNFTIPYYGLITKKAIENRSDITKINFLSTIDTNGNFPTVPSSSFKPNPSSNIPNLNSSAINPLKGGISLSFAFNIPFALSTQSSSSSNKEIGLVTMTYNPLLNQQSFPIGVSFTRSTNNSILVSIQSSAGITNLNIYNYNFNQEKTEAN